jgi:hypothetical protein
MMAAATRRPGEIDMQCLSTTAQQALGGVRRAFAAPVRAGRRSLALGTVLVLGPTLTVLATANTPPTISNVSLSQSMINEGGSVTMTGAFTDPDAADSHTALIFWNDGTKQKVQIPVGQTTFQATHAFADDSSDTSVRVEVRDRQLPSGSNDNSEGLGMDAESLPLEIKNVAPTFAQNVTVAKAPATPGKVIVSGDLVDPGADTLAVFANWNTAVPTVGNGQPCTVSQHHFQCEHTYPVPAIGSKTYSIKLTVRDDDGGWTATTKSVQIP